MSQAPGDTKTRFGLAPGNLKKYYFVVLTLHTHRN